VETAQRQPLQVLLYLTAVAAVAALILPHLHLLREVRVVAEMAALLLRLLLERLIEGVAVVAEQMPQGD
jgi:hypothetical protein